MSSVMLINEINRKMKCSGKYFVDTNVWVYYAYMAHKAYNLDETKKNKLDSYTSFIEKIVEDGGELFTSSLCLSELANAIEREALRQYNEIHGSVLNQKQFRGIGKERAKIISDIEMAWFSIKNVATIIEHSISKKTGDGIITEIKSAPVDAYDAIFLQLIKDQKIINIITDDKDFQKAVEHIDIYTI